MILIEREFEVQSSRFKVEEVQVKVRFQLTWNLEL
jgi:hypothetical protein